MKKIVYRCWCILEVLVIFYVVFVTSLILCRNKYGYTELFGYTFKNIQKNDVEQIKNTKSGDLVVIKNSSKIQINDTIYYYDVSSESYTISNDVVVKVGQAHYTVHTNNGDIEIDSSRIIGKKAKVYPFFGKFLEKIQSHAGFLLFVLLPIVIVFIYQVYEFFFVVRKQLRNDDDSESSFSINTDFDDNLDKPLDANSSISEDKISVISADVDSSDLVTDAKIVEFEEKENELSALDESEKKDRVKLAVENEAYIETEIL